MLACEASVALYCVAIEVAESQSIFGMPSEF